ncbi:MAG: DUF2225 domain-containing protein [Agathobacter sp.]|nr:DUF2225 domain-containing protein [Agathobacter sp.]
MDKILSGLAKFGLDENLVKDLFEEESSSSRPNGAQTAAKVVEPPKETDFLLLKSVRCPICDGAFRTPVIKSGRAKRKEPDLDLRPRFEYIDTNKYDVASCPKCGFTAMHRYFGHLAPVQAKLIKEGVLMKLRNVPSKPIVELEVISYDAAIELYKIALYTSVVKKARDSEKAYTCLKIAWLLRGKMEELSVDAEKNKEAIATCKKDYDTFYQQAFDGFVKAMASENYPMAGMDQSTVDLLIAAMAFNLGQYEYSARFVSELLVSHTASSNVKNRAHDLKEKIVVKLKK